MIGGYDLYGTYYPNLKRRVYMQLLTVLLCIKLINSIP